MLAAMVRSLVLLVVALAASSHSLLDEPESRILVDKDENHRRQDEDESRSLVDEAVSRRRLDEAEIHSLVDEAVSRRLRRQTETGVEIDWNQLLDGLFVLAEQQILADEKDELKIPEVTENFSKKVGPLKIRGSFHATDGHVNSLSSLHRTGEVSLSREGRTLALTSHLGLRVLRVRYDKYRIELLGSATEGEISASVASNSVRSVVKFALRDDGCSLTLDEVKIVDLGRFDVRVSGLGALDWLASKIAVWATDNKRDVIVRKLEEALEKELRKAIGRFDCDQYYEQLREQLVKHIS